MTSPPNRDMVADFRLGCRDHPKYRAAIGQPAPDCDRCRWLRRAGRNCRAILTKGCRDHRSYHGTGRPAKACARCRWLHEVGLAMISPLTRIGR